MGVNPPLDSHERTYLAELMRDFPVQESISVDDALSLLSIRYKNLNTELIVNDLQQFEDMFLQFFRRLPQQLHAYLYKDILANAGSYRQASEKNNGVVFFGRGQKFRGSSPSKIALEVNDLFSTFSIDDPQPVYTIVKFYQQFVRVHPFYDANGRVGRFIASIYLDFHGQFLSWERLRRNNQWLMKLNACHVRENSAIYDEYVQYLVNHWSKFIVEKAAIIPDDDL